MSNTYVPALPVDGSDPVDSESPEDAYTTGTAFRVRQGHSCCGGCCDMRRATIIVSIVSILLKILGMIALLGLVDLMKSVIQSIDDDNVIEEDEEELKKLPVGLLLTLGFLEIGLYGLGVQGGIKFHQGMVIASAVGHFIALVSNPSIVSLIIEGFFIYPHVVFVKEMKSGIMTELNYENERQSCCCVPPP